MSILVASYNMRKAIGADRRRRPHAILDVLAEVDADVVALQEADRRFGSRASAIPIDLLHSYTDYRHVPFDVRPGSIGWHGNAILVRKSVEILDCQPLELPALEPRGAVLAELRLGDFDFRVVGMHLDLSGLLRRHQVRAILAQLESRPPMPAVLMGDLNEWSTHGGSMRAFGSGFSVAATGPSFHARRPVARLDRIIADHRLTIADSGVHHSEGATRASDHLPVWARLVPADRAADPAT